MNENSVNYKWWLVRTNNMEQIADLTSRWHNKKSELMLNQGGKTSGWIHLEDSKAAFIEEHKTALLYYRNGKAIWSGEISDCEDSTESLQCSITALGWFERLNRRLIHTGYEWQEMCVVSSGREIIRYPTEREKENELLEKQYKEVVDEGFYTPVATESAQSLFYSNTPMAEISNDLIIRANIDKPTLITIGETAPTNSVNLTLNQFQNVGEEITKLTAIESGFDFEIHPITRRFNTYRNEIKGGIAGKGIDRTSSIRFTYPGNCVNVNRKSEGTRTQNRTEAVGQFAIGKSESPGSINENGLFEAAVTAPEVVNINILNALAEVETLTLEKPFKIVTFYPKSINKEKGVGRPFEDYEIGDVVYCFVRRGRLKIGLEKSLQPIRVYGFTLEISETGVESIQSIQTVYNSN